MNNITEIINRFISIINEYPLLKYSILICLFISMISAFINTILNALGKSNLEFSDIPDIINNNDDFEFEPVIDDIVIDDLPINCVNCGAPLGDSCVCEYCGTNYT